MTVRSAFASIRDAIFGKPLTHEQARIQRESLHAVGIAAAETENYARLRSQTFRSF